MSDTPRTDAAVIRDKMILTEVGLLDIVDAGTARTLERELAAAKANIARLRRALIEIQYRKARTVTPWTHEAAADEYARMLAADKDAARRALSNEGEQ